MNEWAKSLALYAAAMAQCSPCLTEEQLRAATDAFNELARQHYDILRDAARRAREVRP